MDDHNDKHHNNLALWTSFSVAVVVIVGMAVYFFTTESETGKDIQITRPDSNANTLSTGVSEADEGVDFPDATVSTACKENDDCMIADSTGSVGDCCPMPGCPAVFTLENYVAVNTDSYETQRTALTQLAGCDFKECPEYELPYCPPDQPYGEAECQEGQCVKVIKNAPEDFVETADWLTYTSDTLKFRIQYPADFSVTESTHGFHSGIQISKPIQPPEGDYLGGWQKITISEVKNTPSAEETENPAYAEYADWVRQGFSEPHPAGYHNKMPADSIQPGMIQFDVASGMESIREYFYPTPERTYSIYVSVSGTNFEVPEEIVSTITFF